MSKSTQMAIKPASRDLIASIEPEDASSDDDERIVSAIIETPQGARNKYKYDEETGLFKLSKVLPAGLAFPFSFGFLPKTLGEDGDPLDVLVLADEPVPVGCIVPSRLIGIMEAEQSDGVDVERNDRLIAVAAPSHDHKDLTSFKKINPSFMKEMEEFFVSYHRQGGKTFKVLASHGPTKAKAALEQGKKAYLRARGGKKNR